MLHASGPGPGGCWPPRLGWRACSSALCVHHPRHSDPPVLPGSGMRCFLGVVCRLSSR